MKYCLLALGIAAGLLCLPGQARAQSNPLLNPSFEDYDSFFYLPVGWKDFTNAGERYRRVGDGLGPILVRTGEASLELASGNNFAGFTSDTFTDCLGRYNNPAVTFIDNAGHLEGQDCVVSGWYAIPADQPLVGTLACIKLEFRRADNTIFKWYENFTISGHTNGQWTYFEMTITAAQLDEVYQTAPPEPVRVSVLPIRFGSFAATGTIFWDDLQFHQGCPSDVDHNTFVNGDDYDTFSEWFYFGDPRADYDTNCFVNGDDFDAFTADFFIGC